MCGAAWSAATKACAAFAPATRARPLPEGMGPQALSDEDAAALLTHLRGSWGHRAGAVTALDVLKAR